MCIWCYAWAYASADGQDVLRPMYSPTYGRWERAEGGGLGDDKSHGYLPFDTTLCGIQSDGLSASPYLWVPDWDNACAACSGAAATIDDRWPMDGAGKKREREAGKRSASYEWPPF